MGSKQALALRVAADLADGIAPDWEVLHQSAGPEEQGVLDGLHLLQRLLRSVSDRGEGEPLAVQDRRPPAHRRPTSRGIEGTVQLGRWGHLELIEQIGEGSFGTVYRARDPQLKRPVALKLLKHPGRADSQLVARLLHEGQTLARVRHPHVVTVLGAAEHDGRAGLWMEFLRGLTLEEMLVTHGAFSAGEACLAGQEIASALAAVHHAGLVHRDVKTQNVMRQEGGRLVLMDFGAGQLRSAAADRRIAGTPLYMAPEVIVGAPATVLSDVYSLGVLLYHLVSGAFPVTGRSWRALAQAHAHGDVTPLAEVRPDLPRPFVRVVERAIDPDPGRRFATAARIGEALARVLGMEDQGVDSGRILSGPRRPADQPPVSLAVRAEPPSVAVLPFSDMSAAKNQESFCDGLTLELISGLAQIPDLRVAARTSTFQFKGQARDVRQIGDALNVSTVLEGSVRREGDALRVTVELVGVADGYHLWSQTFNRRAADIFAVQDDIASSVVGALKGRMAGRRYTTAQDPQRGDPKAYGSYLEGRYHWNKRTEDELKKSLRCFHEATAGNPDFGPAHAGLADAYVTLGTYGALRPRIVIPRAKRAIARALACDPELAEAYACRGCVGAVYDWSWEAAEADFRRAIECNPSYPTAHHWLAINHLVPLGRFEEARDELHRALALDPLNLAIQTSVGMTSYFQGQYRRAVGELSRAAELDATFGMAHLFLGATLTEIGQVRRAAQALERAVSLCGRTPEVLAAIGYLQGRAGDRPGAESILAELAEMAPRRYVSAPRLAQVHVGLGNQTQALACLEQARAERAADLAWIAVRPVFKPLHAAPRFSQIVKGLGLSSASRRDPNGY